MHLLTLLWHNLAFRYRELTERPILTAEQWKRLVPPRDLENREVGQ